MKKQKVIKNKRIFFMFIMVICLLLTMSIGYSTLHQILYVRGDSIIKKPDYLIYIDNVEVFNSSNNSYQNSNPTYSNTTAGTYSVLPNINSTIIYKARIVNAGKTSGILDYTIVNADNEQIKYKIKGINNGDILASDEFVDVYIIFEYWDDVSSISNNTISSIIEFQFTQHSDNYSNACTNSWDGTSTSEPLLVDVYGTNYYQISNANEFAWFVNAINNGSTNINGYLSDNICLNSKYLQINNYSGIFDGQNRKIEGFNFTSSVDIGDSYNRNTGLFNTNSGTIKNVNLDSTITDDLYYKPGTFTGNDNITLSVAPLVAVNSGRIANVSVTGSLTTDYSVRTSCAAAKPTLNYYIGGIVGQNNGVITGSYNKSTVYTRNTVSRTACNYSKYYHMYEGGIAGQNSGYISDCYNNNTITSSTWVNNDNSRYYGRIGGLVGNFASGVIKNSYNSGTVAHEIEETEGGVAEERLTGGAIGNSSGTVSNVYYLDSCGFAGTGTAVSSGDLSNLNISIGNFFMRDVNSSNNGYPILGWQ